MADQTRKPKPKKDEEEAQAKAEETTEASTADVDELLDEIDEVLEVNAEEFVRSFIQKGGQAFVPMTLLSEQNGVQRWLLAGMMITVYMVYRFRSRFVTR